MAMDAGLDRRVVRIRRASTVGVVLLAGGGFAMSYGALHGLALAEGVDPALAWMWPLIVDGFIVVASLAVLHAVLERRSTLYPWCLVLGFSAISVAFNVLHAAPTPVARLVGCRAAARAGAVAGAADAADPCGARAASTCEAGANCAAERWRSYGRRVTWRRRQQR